MRFNMKFKLIIFILSSLKIDFTVGTSGEPECLKIESNSINESFLCRNIRNSSQMINFLPNDTEDLIIEDSFILNTNDKDDTAYKEFKNLSKVTIKSSYFAAIEDWLYLLPNLKYLNIVQSSQSYLINHVDINITVVGIKIDSFESLLQLNVSHCNISDLAINNSEKKSPSLILSYNRFECGSTNFTWLLNAFEDQKSQIELQNNVCFMKQVNKGPNPILYSLRGKPLLLVQHYKREASVNCPVKCVCEFFGMITISRPILNVDCIGLNMTKLPDVIPKGTSRCNFSQNLIEDMSPLFSNSLYDSVGMIALSHNRISYLDPVKLPENLRSRKDVGYWLDHNRLTKFPAHAVKKVYDDDEMKNQRFKAFFVLSGNPWMCSCDYIWDFQDLIYRHTFDILNEREIRCSEDDPHNPGVSILTLDVGAICSDVPLFEPLDLINMALGFVLFILIVDFAYNYRQYHKHRKLPWIVTKFQ